jgi:hypothetical protein
LIRVLEDDLVPGFLFTTFWRREGVVTTMEGHDVNEKRPNRDLEGGSRRGGLACGKSRTTDFPVGTEEGSVIDRETEGS